jgi:sulfur-carrier protein
MPRVSFTSALARHVACPPREVAGTTVRTALDAALAANPGLRPYVLDEQGALRKHITVFIGSEVVQDRTTLSEPVAADAQIHVMQALSGG